MFSDFDYWTRFEHVSQALYSFDKNKIVPILFNTVTGKNVSLVVKKSELNRALNVIHGEIFWQAENKYCIFGHGLVGER
jgi:neutral trehalase